MDQRRAYIFEKVRHIASTTFRCDPDAIVEGTTAKDVQKWDSLRHLVFIGNVEKEFKCRFDLDRVARLHNIGDLVDEIDRISPA